MGDVLKLFKGDTVVDTAERGANGKATVKVTGLTPNTDIPVGTYQLCWEIDGLEGPKIDCSASKTKPVSVTSVTLAPATVSVDVGKTTKLTPTVAPTNATNKAVTYTSGTPANATVATDGTVTGVKAGTSVITVKTTDGYKIATSTVTVTTPVIPVTSVTLSPKTSTGETGTAGTRQLTGTIAPTTATNKKMTYAIAPVTDGLAVNGSGLISWTDTVAPGTYTTTVTTTDGSKKDTHVLILSAPVEG